jgi:hypothetical protein
VFEGFYNESQDDQMNLSWKLTTMEPITYTEMNTGEEQAVCDLVAQVFDEYVASDYEQDGVEEFFRCADLP